MEELLKVLHERKASDLILSSGASPQLRIRGELEPLDISSLTSNEIKELAYSILSKDQIEEFETKKDMDISYSIKNVARYRINMYIQKGEIGVAIRLVPYEMPEMEELGLPADILEGFIIEQNGLVLVTGPAGSGKSTTLAAMVNHINKVQRKHIICIEDPIEFVHRNIESVVDQREVGSDTNSFANALKRVFRQSPDVIMVGEIRDLESISLALTLAETGHLILATLHTQNTIHAITRIVDVFPAAQQRQIRIQLSLVLVGILTQRLLPAKDKVGRVLAYEIMNVTGAIRNLIRENKIEQIYTVLQTGKSKGMITLDESIRRLYDQHKISAKEVLKKEEKETSKFF